MISEREKALMLKAYQAGYSRGHNDTVESCFNFSCEAESECFDDWLEDQDCE